MTRRSAISRPRACSAMKSGRSATRREERSGRQKGSAGIRLRLDLTALDADSKLMISWLVSDRGQEAADAIIRVLKSRVPKRIQLSSDSLSQYVSAVVSTFHAGEIDHAGVAKVFANSKTA